MENNKRLIDANALEKKSYIPITPFCGRVISVKDLRDAPTVYTVDTAGVVHGYWQLKRREPVLQFSCTKCGFGVGFNMRMLANYCPQCGAKMDGDKHE